MQNSAIIKILTTFDSEEMRSFGDFIKSPFFNKKGNVVKLFDDIRKYYPEFDRDELDSKLSWERLFPGKPYNYGIMKNLIYELSKLAERFLQITNSEKSEINKSTRLLLEYMRRKLDKLFEKEVKSTQKLFKDTKLDSAIYFTKHFFESVYHSHIYNNKISLEKYNSISTFNSSLLEFFFTTFFNRNYASVLDKDRLKIDADEETVKSVREFFNNSTVKTNEDILVFYYYFEMANQSTSYDAFRKFKDSIEKNYLKYSKRQLYIFYTCLIDFCYRNLNNKLLSKSEIFGVCKSMIDKGLYTNDTNKFMNPLLYTDIVEAALPCHEFKWVKKFIEDYKVKLNPDVRNDFYDKATVMYLIATKDYTRALERISTSRFSHPLDKLISKIFQFKIYYEINNIEGIYLLIDSSRHFVTIDKQISDESRKSFLDFVSVMKKLVSLNTKLNSDKDIYPEIENLKKEILSKNLPEEFWICEKLEEMRDG